jgi:hypothetical protein
MLSPISQGATGKAGICMFLIGLGATFSGIISSSLGVGIMVLGAVLGSWWFIVPLIWRQVPVAIKAPAGFRLEENQLFQENGLHGVRIRLRPKDRVSETTLRYSYDASLTLVRWRVEKHRGGRFPEIGMEWIEREAGNEAARAVEIGFFGPPDFNPNKDLVVELIGPGWVRVTKIERLS